MAKILELYMYRFAFKKTYTIGDIWIGQNGRKLCDTLEDRVRDVNHNGKFDNGEEKVFKTTAILCGRYRVTMNVQSPTFKKKAYYMKFCNGYMPRLLNTPFFEGVLIHRGYTENDSAGCILVGENKEVGRLTNTQDRFEELYGILERANKANVPIYINIIDAVNGEHVKRKKQTNDEKCEFDVKKYR